MLTFNRCFRRGKPDLSLTIRVRGVRVGRIKPCTDGHCVYGIWDDPQVFPSEPEAKQAVVSWADDILILKAKGGWLRPRPGALV